MEGDDKGSVWRRGGGMMSKVNFWWIKPCSQWALAFWFEWVWQKLKWTKAKNIYIDIYLYDTVPSLLGSFTASTWFSSSSVSWFVLWWHSAHWLAAIRVVTLNCDGLSEITLMDQAMINAFWLILVDHSSDSQLHHGSCHQKTSPCCKQYSSHNAQEWPDHSPFVFPNAIDMFGNVTQKTSECCDSLWSYVHRRRCDEVARPDPRWSRLAFSSEMSPCWIFVLRCHQRLLICRLSFTQIPVLFSLLHLHGNQKGKGSPGRKEPQQKDDFSDICKLKSSNSKGGNFPGTPCRDCRHLPHIQFKAQGWIPGTATLRRPLKVSLEMRFLLCSGGTEAESELSKTGVHIGNIRTVERVWKQKWWFESFVKYDGNCPRMDV